MRSSVCSLLVLALTTACGDPPTVERDGSLASVNERSIESIVPITGYTWPQVERDYWPTAGWRNGPPEQHGLDPERLAIADATAERDPYFRSLLVVKDGEQELAKSVFITAEGKAAPDELALEVVSKPNQPAPTKIQLPKYL